MISKREVGAVALDQDGWEKSIRFCVTSAHYFRRPDCENTAKKDSRSMWTTDSTLLRG